jgi:hypothetical protein
VKGRREIHLFTGSSLASFHTIRETHDSIPFRVEEEDGTSSIIGID